MLLVGVMDGGGDAGEEVDICNICREATFACEKLKANKQQANIFIHFKTFCALVRCFC